MSLPEMIKYINLDLEFLNRISEYENQNTLQNYHKWDMARVLLKMNGIRKNFLKNLLNMNKNIFFVSSELHNRDYNKQWGLIKKTLPSDKVFLCTDCSRKAIFND